MMVLNQATSIDDFDAAQHIMPIETGLSFLNQIKSLLLEPQAEKDVICGKPLKPDFFQNFNGILAEYAVFNNQNTLKALIKYTQKGFEYISVINSVD